MLLARYAIPVLKGLAHFMAQQGTAFGGSVPRGTSCCSPPSLKKLVRQEVEY